MKLYNTLTRKTEDFTPLNGTTVNLYACGLTVYSQPHIGNWVAYIYWDVLVRTLKAVGYNVNHVQNITDVGHLTSDEDAGEDKMLASAFKENTTAWQVAEKYIKIADHEAYELLRLNRPTHMPRATDYIAEQIAFVEELESKGFTYVIEDGVYFDTSKLSDYGKLAQLDIKGLQFGARVEDTGKRNPTDFALWKFSPKDQTRDMEWDSKWGKGFPGWHLECSVMSRELLGDQIDIHTGGIDHIPVHHTNEIAQTESLTGKQFSQFWVHANHIKVDGTKMSKSLGNIYTLADVVSHGFELQAFKLMILSKHYQTEGNFTWDIIEAAQNLLKKWQASADLRWQPQKQSTAHDFGAIESKVLEALQNNLDTPKAMIAVDAITAIESVSTQQVAEFNQLLQTIDELLGIDLQKGDISDKQKQLLQERESSRESKDWQRSDELREELRAQGLEVRDTPNGSIWSRV